VAVEADADGAPGRDADGMRFRLLETLRHYGQERLAEAGEGTAARRRHAAYFLAVVEATEPLLFGAEEVVGVGRLRREHDNLRAALDWLTSAGEPEAALRMASLLWKFWQRANHLGEGLHWLELALERDTAEDAAGRPERLRARAWALDAAGSLS